MMRLRLPNACYRDLPLFENFHFIDIISKMQTHIVHGNKYSIQTLYMYTINVVSIISAQPGV